MQPFPATGAFYQVSKATEDGHHSVWSRDGRTLFYTPGPGPVLVAVPVTATTAFTMGEPKTLNRQFGNEPPQISRPYDVAADGRFLGIGSATGTGNAGGNTVLVVLNWFEELKARVPVR